MEVILSPSNKDRIWTRGVPAAVQLTLEFCRYELSIPFSYHFSAECQQHFCNIFEPTVIRILLSTFSLWTTVPLNWKLVWSKTYFQLQRCRSHEGSVYLGSRPKVCFWQLAALYCFHYWLLREPRASFEARGARSIAVASSALRSWNLLLHLHFAGQWK